MVRMVLAVALAAAATAASHAQRGAAPAAAPAGGCLHGPSERADQRARRIAALEYIKRVSFLENEGKLQAEQYYTLADLPQLPSAPRGFKIQLSTDGATFVLSAKDTQDPCGFAYFTDQDGKIYSATPVPAAP